MQFRVLGPIEVHTAEGAAPIGGPKQRTVLALLALSANRVVVATRLMDALWGEEPPETARNTLQTYVRHLRKALGAERIEHRSSGYVLVADADEVDHLRFQGLVAEARRLTPEDPQRAIAIYGEALDLWRGPALDDLADQPALQADIARLEESRMTALEDRIAVDLQRGRHRELVAELEVMVRRHPFRERLWGHLIVALYRSGRQGDALDAYRRARTLLVEELGIDPSPELHHLEERILRQDPGLELAGEQLRGYRLLEPIGEGAFGLVYRAQQPQVGREVAVKVIRPDLANDPDFVRAFEREARIIARLEHRHIVPLYDYWRDRDGAYLVMRLFRAGSLRTRIDRSGPLTVPEAGGIVEQVALALGSALEQGIVHGDVKPENILLDDEHNAYLSDFGIARDLAGASPTRIGVGHAPAYASPERVRGSSATHAGDVYALGMVLREALAGVSLPRTAEDVIARACAEDPDARHVDALAFAAAFRVAIGAAVEVPPDVPRLEITNPYKGLRSFDEPDAADFFGRSRMVDRLVARLAERTDGSRLLAVVGPSGSGKSSLVRAGLVPALRRGALPVAEAWFTTELTPGLRPFHELEAALPRVAIDPPANLLDELRRDERGLLDVADRILPADGRTELLVVVDQFEELYTLTTTESERSSFLASLTEAVTDPSSRVRIVLMLRADFYDRPLLDARFGPMLAARTEGVTPLAPDELALAISGPAERAGVSLEPSLTAEMLAEVAEQPSALPLLQFALTELFERRDGRTMTSAAYREIGRVSGALVGRAEELFATLDTEEQEICRQLFLRLVELGEGTEDTRRRVPRSELDVLRADPRTVDHVIEAFGGHRLLAFDRDVSTREPTVELAHEALIRVWARFRDWIDGSREDLRLHRRLAGSADDWLNADREPSFLLTGARLERFESWVAATRLALDPKEREFVDRSVDRRRTEGDAERERVTHERALERRSVQRLRGIVAVLAAAALVAAGLTVVAVNRSREAERLRDEATVAALTEAAVSSLTSDPDRSILLALHAVDVSDAAGESVPSATVEALHWALEEAGVTYPAVNGPPAVVTGPGGTRGVFAEPISQLVTLARSNVTGSLSSSDCERFFATPSCPALPESFRDSLSADPVRAIEPADPAQPLAGTHVTVFGSADPARIEVLQDVFRSFTARTGIQVRLVGTLAFDYVAQSVEAGDPPDIAFVAQVPGILQVARTRRLVDLGAVTDIERLKSDQSPYLVSLGTTGDDGSWPSRDGTTFGAFVDLQIKSLIWYPTDALASAGYDVPRTWRDLVSLSDRLKSAGRTPWCMGWRSGGSDGWPGTDWIENLVMLEGGPSLYDRWTDHEVPFQSEPVRNAFERLGTILFDDGADDEALGGAFDTAQRPMLKDPPGCWLYQFADFASAFLPPDSVGRSTDFIPFPSAPGRPPALIGGGEMVAGLSDRPEVREVMRFILGPTFGTRLARAGVGVVSANSTVGAAVYPAAERREAQLLYSALAADTFRFDASDLMPINIGARVFLRSMMRYAAQGPGSLDRILAGLDAAWPEHG
jgi:DNA-binding SARP family transcriptional activator/ABC-type glycerol-3-phosphate transport system substrate-binding protein